MNSNKYIQLFAMGGQKSYQINDFYNINNKNEDYVNTSIRY